ncbi:hypothetical protein ACRAWC_01790 [Leifsonia sp. L25]|uniref:hypothetical protein n=1 Tax=Actinomycetes TaxID=1760 RepID=UPI003D69EB63
MTDLHLDLAVLDEATNVGISAAYNEIGARVGLAPLDWKLSDVADTTIEATHPLGRAHPDGESLCRQWAEYLGLCESDENLFPYDGCVTWSGCTPESITLMLHAITDVELYRANWPEDAGFLGS